MPIPSLSNINSFYDSLANREKIGLQTVFEQLNQNGRHRTNLDDGKLILALLRDQMPSSISSKDPALNLVTNLTHHQLKETLKGMTVLEINLLKDFQEEEDGFIESYHSDENEFEDDFFPKKESMFIEKEQKFEIKVDELEQKNEDVLQAVTDTFDAIRSDRGYSIMDSKKMEDNLLNNNILSSDDLTTEQTQAYRIFQRFDEDQDGFLNFQEVKNFIKAVKNADFTLESYIGICTKMKEDPATGVRRHSFLQLYSSGYSNLNKDYNILFSQSFDTQTTYSEDTSAVIPAPNFHSKTLQHPPSHLKEDPFTQNKIENFDTVSLAESARTGRTSFKIDREIKSKALQLFQRFDANMDGFMDFQEIVNFVTATDPMREVTREDYVKFCKQLGCDPHVGVDFESLLLFYANGEANLDDDYYAVFDPQPDQPQLPIINEQQMDSFSKVKRIFECFDSDDDGHLNRIEMSMLLSTTSPHTIMLSKEKFAQRCTILNCDPNLGINLEGLFHLYNTLSPSYLDNDYGIIFHKPETPGNISSQGWANMPVDYDSSLATVKDELSLESITCGTNGCAGHIRMDPDARHHRCNFCVEYHEPSRGYACCPRCHYSLCHNCFVEMVDFKKTCRAPSVGGAPTITSVGTSAALREFQSVSNHYAGYVSSYTHTRPHPNSPFADNSFDRASLKSIPYSTYSSRSSRVPVLEPVRENNYMSNRRRTIPDEMIGGSEYNYSSQFRPRKQSYTSAHSSATMGRTRKRRKFKTRYESNEAYKNLTEQEWDDLMEDIKVMKNLMGHISHFVSLIKQKKVRTKKEKNILYKKMQGMRDQLMALLGKYGAEDTKTGVRVMRRALENFKLYKQSQKNQMKNKQMGPQDTSKYRVVIERRKLGFEIGPRPGGIGARVTEVNKKTKSTITEGSMILAINGEDVALANFSDVYEMIKSPQRPLTIIFSNPSIHNYLTE